MELEEALNCLERLTRTLARGQEGAEARRALETLRNALFERDQNARSNEPNELEMRAALRRNCR